MTLMAVHNARAVGSRAGIMSVKGVGVKLNHKIASNRGRVHFREQKKDLESAGQDAKKQFQEGKENVKDTAQDMQDRAGNQWDKVTDKAGDQWDKVTDKADTMKERASGAVDEAKDAADRFTERISDNMNGFKLLISAMAVGSATLAVLIFSPDLLSKVGMGAEIAHITTHNIWYNMLGSIFASLAAVSAAALRNPVKFAPVFAMMTIYKGIWLATTGMPRLLSGALSGPYSTFVGITFAMFGMGVMFVPWDYVLKEVRQEADKHSAANA